MTKSLVYLACPYSHPDAEVRRLRFEAANRAAGKLMQDGVFVFSPISHSHPIALACELPLGWEFWEAFDRAYLTHCHKMIVPMLDGWETSRGIANEIKIANELGLVVEWMVD